jgi:hypothetical protein
VKSAKAAKPAKSEKSKVEKPVEAKAEPEELYPAPKEVGGVWPFRAGTAMRYVFQAIYEKANGMTPKQFEAMFAAPDKKAGTEAGPLFGVHAANSEGNAREQAAKSCAFLLKVMRSGANCSSWHGGSTLTHTWEFSEEGGRYKIYNVKYVKQTEKKAAEAVSGKKGKKAA